MTNRLSLEEYAKDIGLEQRRLQRILVVAAKMFREEREVKMIRRVL